MTREANTNKYSEYVAKYAHNTPEWKASQLYASWIPRFSQKAYLVGFMTAEDYIDTNNHHPFREDLYAQASETFEQLKKDQAKFRSGSKAEALTFIKKEAPALIKQFKEGGLSLDRLSTSMLYGMADALAFEHFYGEHFPKKPQTCNNLF